MVNSQSIGERRPFKCNPFQSYLLNCTAIDLFLNFLAHFIIAYHNSLVKDQTNYYNKNQLILDVEQLNKTKKLYYCYAFNALWDGQGKIKMNYGMSRVKKQLSGKRSIV